MARTTHDVGVIGGGAAGLAFAAGAAKLGARVLLVEKSDRLGGDCLHFGCVPSKALLHVAAAWRTARDAPRLGLPQLALPPVDLAAVMARVARAVAAVAPHDSPERFRSLGVEVRFGAARFVDAHTLEVEGESLSARTFVVATGSHPALPPVAGLAELPYWTNETLFTQTKLPAHLLVLGGGPVGLELAQAFARLGSRVSVVEFLDRVLAAEEPEISELITKRLRAEGVDFLVGTKAVRAERAGEGVRLFVAPAAGGEERPLTGDALLVAAGRRPNVEELGLEAAGVSYTPKGIPTDLRLRTNVPTIYALGDVNGKLPFTHTAGAEASVAVTNAILRLPRRINYDRVPRTLYTDPEVASVGIDEATAKARNLRYRIVIESFRDNDRALAEGEAEGRLKLVVGKGDRVLGASIAGARAGELIHEWTATMAGGVKLSAIASAVHAYPTLSEISQRAAGAYYAPMLFGARTRKILRFLFGYRGEPSEE